MSDKHFIGFQITGFEDSGQTKPVSRVTLNVDEATNFSAGDDTGLELVGECATATQEMCDALLAKLKGYKYQMYTADAASIDPAAELGDGVTVGDVYGVITSIADDGDGYPGIAAPGEEELDDEYPMGGGPITQKFNKKMAEQYSVFEKTADEIRGEVHDTEEGLHSLIDQTAGEIYAEVEDTKNQLQASIDMTAEEIRGEVTDAKNQLQASIDMTAEEIRGEVTDAKNELQSSIDMTAEEIRAEVENAKEGLQASIDMTAEEIRSEVSDVEEGLQSSIDQKAGEITLRVDAVEKKAAEDLQNFSDEVANNLEAIQSQLDKQIMTWYYSGIPSTSNAPAKDWKTDTDKALHEGDLYYNKDTGYCYRWEKSGTTWKWTEIHDDGIQSALDAANDAQDTADNKRRVFVAQPKPPYDVGDLWTQGNGGELYRCKTPKTTGQSFSQNDWELATKYTDDSRAEELHSELKVELEGITLSVSNSTDSSIISLKIGETIIRSSTIKMTGLVTFDSLKSGGTTQIDGSRITTGKISADRIDVENLVLKLSGNISFSDLSDSDTALNGYVKKNSTTNVGTLPTYIDANQITSPNIYGGIYWDRDGSTNLILDPNNYGSADLVLQEMQHGSPVEKFKVETIDDQVYVYANNPNIYGNVPVLCWGPGSAALSGNWRIDWSCLDPDSIPSSFGSATWA